MNQRLIIIISIILFLFGIVGIFFSDSNDKASAEEAQLQSSPRITHFITKRVMAAGELITKDDYEEKTETVTDTDNESESLETVDGFYLTESVRKGTRLTKSLLTKEKPLVRNSNELYRYTVVLNKQYVNNLYGLLPGADIDVYIRFESPKREHDNRSTIYRGESVVKIVKLFKNKKLLTSVMRGRKVLSTDEEAEVATKNLLDSDEYTIDIELSRSDLKKIYQIENKYEMIVFPAESMVRNKIGETTNKKDIKK